MSVPADLMAALQGQQGGGYSPGQDPLEVLQTCIQQLPAVMQALPDPKDVQDAARALLLLTGIQTRLMSGGGQPAAGG